MLYVIAASCHPNPAAAADAVAHRGCETSVSSEVRPAILSAVNKESQTSSSLYDIYDEIDEQSVEPASNLAERPYLRLFYRSLGIIVIHACR